MICINCKKQCHAQYWNRETKRWECSRETPYLKGPSRANLTQNTPKSAFNIKKR